MQGQQQLVLAELKRVGTQQEQLKKAVSEAAAEAASQGEAFEIAPLSSFKIGDSELAHLKSMQLKDQLRSQTEAAATAAEQAPLEEEALTSTSAAEKPTAVTPAVAAAPAGELLSTDQQLLHCLCGASCIDHHIFVETGLLDSP